MKFKENYNYDEDTKTAYYEMIVDGRVFSGSATCHPEDIDFANKITGLTIAHDRAFLQYMRYLRDISYQRYLAYDLLLRQIKDCKRFNPDSFETRSMIVERDAAYDDYKTLQHESRELYNGIGVFINKKADLYNKIQNKRNLDKIE